MSKLIPET